MPYSFRHTVEEKTLKLHDVITVVEGISVYPNTDLETEVYYGGGADLMSDVLRFGRDDMLLITGLTNPQVIRTAEMVGIPALLFVRAKMPPPETTALAKEARIALFATRFTLYEACGLLYEAGLLGIGPCGDFGKP
jgi:hypothetical protein